MVNCQAIELLLTLVVRNLNSLRLVSISISNPYLTCLGPTNIKGIALSIISRGGHALSRFGAPPRLHTTEVATTLAIT